MLLISKFEFEEPFSDHLKDNQQVWFITKMFSFISSIVSYLISG